MIHDFATHSKCNEPADLFIEKRKPAIPASPTFSRRQAKVIAVVFTLVITLSISVYSRTKTEDTTLAEFTPGVSEIQDYRKEASLSNLQEMADFELQPAESTGSMIAEILEPAMSESETLEQAAFEAAVNNGPVSAEADYGFYDSLQASPWDIPVQKGIYITEEDLKRATYTYMLQAASMRSRSDATSLVRKLKEMGMKATYTKSGGSYGDTWYRVNVGPFTDVSVMNKAENRLVAMRMMPLKRRVQ